MPATYTLRSATNASAGEVISYLGHVQGFGTKNDALVGLGLRSIDVYQENAFGQKTIRKAFGFTPRIAVSVIPDKFEQFEQGLDSIAELLNCWFRDQAGDLALLLDHELVIAIRLDDQVILNHRSSFWSGDRRNRITVPHRFEDTPEF